MRCVRNPVYRLDRALPLIQNTQEPGWKARLNIVLSRKDGKTVLEHVSHEGPLRIQRPFYPEGEGLCHLYLLHPPGGMVTGDALNVCVTLEKGAQALATTPSAGKIYRADSTSRKQLQQVELRLEDEAVLEWLPQETIIFNGARGEVSTVMSLAPNAQMLLWDVVCLGRPASGELFSSGHLVQKLLLRRGGKTIYRERNFFAGGSEGLSQPWGMKGQPVGGTCIATCVLAEPVLAELREALSSVVCEGVMAVSQVEQCLLARYLGPSAEECRKGFERVRSVIRPLLAKNIEARESSRPRIWNT